MTTRPVHWHEGMFLLPQHLQAAQRHGTHIAQLSDKWNDHYSWGVRLCEIDLEALANHRLVVRTLRARLNDGTLIAVPEDGLLPVLDLQTALEGVSNLRIFLAVPVFDLSRANVSITGADDKARYQVDTQELEDETTGLHPQPVEIRRLNVKLLLSTADRTGYETLPIAQIKKADRAKVPPMCLQSAKWRSTTLSVGRRGRTLFPASAPASADAPAVETAALPEDQSTPNQSQIVAGRIHRLNERPAPGAVVLTARKAHRSAMCARIRRVTGSFRSPATCSPNPCQAAVTISSVSSQPGDASSDRSNFPSQRSSQLTYPA